MKKSDYEIVITGKSNWVWEYKRVGNHDPLCSSPMYSRKDHAKRGAERFMKLLKKHVPIRVV